MKPGARAIGIAESYTGARSTVAGAVVRADRVVDGLGFTTCRVGGTDATGRIGELVRGLERDDAQYVFIAGIAPAWYNMLDLPAIYRAVDRPVLSITFEASVGLEHALEEAFSGDDLEDRLAIYRRQPPRDRVVVNGDPMFVRSTGIAHDAARDVVRAFTPEGGRPEPLRVARLAARAGDRLRGDS